MDRVQRVAPIAARIVLGMLFTMFGLNGFFHFIPEPPMPQRASAFMAALAATGYMLPLLKGTEVVAGLLLLSGRAVPFALTLLAPVVVNIFAFHVFLAPAGTPIALFALLMGLYVAYEHRAAYRQLFAAADHRMRASRPSVLSAA